MKKLTILEKERTNREMKDKKPKPAKATKKGTEQKLTTTTSPKEGTEST